MADLALGAFRSTATTITMSIPKHLVMNANHRLNRWRKAEKTDELRQRAGWAARASKIKLDRAHLTVHVHWPDNRRRDEANLAPTTKAIIDGFVDGGLLPDDDRKHLIGPDYRPADPITGPHGVVLVFEFGPYGGAS